MKREEELKPCPFCGSSAHVEQYGDVRQSTKYQCDDCGCMLETGEEWDFGRDWNRRALLPNPNPEAEPEPDAWMDEFGEVSTVKPAINPQPLYLHPPKPEPVGWETDAEWDLEMRCCNITENTPFDEVSKLINDLWQQYCLAAEPKQEATEGVDRHVHHSKPVVFQNTKIVEDKATEGGAHEKEDILDLYRMAAHTDVTMERVHFLGVNRAAFKRAWEADRAALTAKQTDGRDGE